MKKTIIIICIVLVLIGGYAFFMLNLKDKILIRDAQKQNVHLDEILEPPTEYVPTETTTEKNLEDELAKLETEETKEDKIYKDKIIEPETAEEETTSKTYKEKEDEYALTGNALMMSVFERVVPKMCYPKTDDEDCNIYLAKDSQLKYDEATGILDNYIKYDKLNKVWFYPSDNFISVLYTKDGKSETAEGKVQIIPEDNTYKINDIKLNYDSGATIETSIEYIGKENYFLYIVLNGYDCSPAIETDNNRNTEDDLPYEFEKLKNSEIILTQEFLERYPDLKILGNIEEPIYDIKLDYSTFEYASNQLGLIINDNYYRITYETNQNKCVINCSTEKMEEKIQ